MTQRLIIPPISVTVLDELGHFTPTWYRALSEAFGVVNGQAEAAEIAAAAALVEAAAATVAAADATAEAAAATVVADAAAVEAATATATADALAIIVDETTPIPVASLPFPTNGLERNVLDADTPVLNAVVVGGGISFAHVTGNGLDWLVS